MTDPAQIIKSEIESRSDEIIKLRRTLHQIPETGLDLPTTNAKMRDFFDKLGCDIHDAQSVSGFVAILRGGAKGKAHNEAKGESKAENARPTVLLRADMDALPVQEQTELDWASTNGNMHACGHDLHMAGLVGAAWALKSVQQHLAGDVVFFLQPGEEGHNGAQHLIDEDLLSASGALPDHAYGLHVFSGRFERDAIISRPGPLMASSDVVTITIHGKGGHGSAPFLALDPVPIAAEIVTQTHVAVTREFDISDPVVLTCGKIEAGTAPNVIPDSATASFTLRAFSVESRARLISTLQRLAEGICAAHATSCTVDVEELYPVTVNNSDEFEFSKAVIEEHFPGRFSHLDAPLGAAEDFSKILERIPGAFIFVSAVENGVNATEAPFNHSPFATFDDAVLPDCSQLLAQLALARLTT